LATEQVLSNIDLNDTPFVALTKHLSAKLWTGDKELTIGLTPFDYIEILSTVQLSNLLDRLQQ
jgi:predicted nucleic acid-binding protein